MPAALGKGDKNDDDTDATGAARRVADRCMGWGLFAGTALGLLQIACLPLVRCFSPLPEVRAAARTPAFLSALAQPVNGVAFVAEGVLLGLGAFRFLAAQTAVGAVRFSVPGALYTPSTRRHRRDAIDGVPRRSR